MLNDLLKENKVIRDNIHGNIKINYQIIWDLIDSNAFQRLRRIHQLGGTYMVFPGAEHSRFTHSLGVYHIVNRMTNEVPDIVSNLSEREKITALCAALLHDIGHGPFSHAFESVFKTDHEKIGINLIKGDSEIKTIFDQYDSAIAQEVAQVIEKTHPNKILIQMISSQVDADRMDYLLRDAYNCGVSYGNFDLERVLRSMVVHDKAIAFKESGVHALEDYIFARYHMYWQVYLHPSANSFELLMTKILHRIKTLHDRNYQFKINIELLRPFFNLNELTLGDYLALDESVITFYFSRLQNEDDDILANLAHCFMNRKLFKHLDLVNETEGYRIINSIEPDKEKQENYFEVLKSSNILYNQYGKVVNQRILVKKKDKSIEDLHRVSDLVGAITKSASSKEEVKLFYHQNYMKDLYGKS